MSHNRKVLTKATNELGKAKAPSKPIDKPYSQPIVSSEGYKQGPPPSGSHYRIPGNEQGTSIYNPTPYPLNLVGPNGTHAQIGPWDTNTQNFEEPYMDEYPQDENDVDYEDELDEEQIAELRAGGYTVEDISVPSLTQAKKGGSLKKYSKNIEATNKLLRESELLKKIKSKKKKIFDPSSSYFKVGGVPELPLTEGRIAYERLGYTDNDRMAMAQVGGQKEGEVLDIPEMQAYADPAKRKLQGKLLDKARAIASTIEGRQALKEGNYKDFSIESMKKFIKSATDYKKEAEDYHKARRLVSEEKMDPGSFARRYNEKGWAKFDEATANENYKGEYQQAVDKANKRKGKNMAYTDAVLELTGAPALQRIASDPIGTAKGIGQTVGDIATLPYGVVKGAYNYATDGNFDMGTNAFGQKYGEGLNETMDVLNVLPFVKGLGATKGLIPKINIPTKTIDVLGKAIKKAPQLGRQLIDEGYPTFARKLTDKLSPLNLVPGYGSKLKGSTVPLGNILEDVVQGSNVIAPKNKMMTAFNAVTGRSNAPGIISSAKNSNRNANTIFSAKIDPSKQGTNLSFSQTANPLMLSKFRNSNKLQYNLQNAGRDATEIPLLDPAVSLHRRLPFSNKYVSVDPQKLMNNKFQWSTAGTGAQNLAEKYGSNALGLAGLSGAGLSGMGALQGLNPMDTYNSINPETGNKIGEEVMNEYKKDINFKTYISKPDPYFSRTIGTGAYDIYDNFIKPNLKKNGGPIEMELDDDMIQYLLSQGYDIEDID